jgi:hypothetical protein
VVKSKSKDVRKLSKKTEKRTCYHCDQLLTEEDIKSDKWCGYCFSLVHKKCNGSCPTLEAYKDADRDEDFDEDLSED